MWRPAVSGLGLVLLLFGCQKQEAPAVGKRPAAPGEAARPFQPAQNKGDGEAPRLRELRKGKGSGRH